MDEIKAILSLVALNPTDGFTVVCHGGFTHRITERAEKTLNRMDQELLEHSVSPAYPAIAPPSFPCRPGSSILIDCHFGGSSTENQGHHGIEKEFTEGDGCTYIFLTIMCTDR